MNSPQLTHVTKLSSTLMSICWQTELNLIQKVRPGSTICSPKCANSIRKHRLVAGVAAGCMCLFNDELLTPTVVSSTRARVSSGTLQCVHSQCILTGFYKTYKIIWEGIQFLETCYSVPFKKKKKRKNPKTKQKTVMDQAPSQLGGTNHHLVSYADLLNTRTGTEDAELRWGEREA